MVKSPLYLSRQTFSSPQQFSLHQNFSSPQQFSLHQNFSSPQQFSPRQRVALRRGFALIDAILGGILLALGLTAVVTLSQRSLVMLQRGEHEAQASALLDELLGQVLAEGPVDFARRRPVRGNCDAPWNEWSFVIDLSSNGEGEAWDVMASVKDSNGIEHRCATKIAPRDTQETPARKPEKPIDRKDRYEKKHEVTKGG